MFENDNKDLLQANNLNHLDASQLTELENSHGVLTKIEIKSLHQPINGLGD